MADNEKVIKRYQNRKLYDTQSSRYVTLDDIAEMIRAGENVRILDNATKADLTSLTLTQIIFDQEKKQRSILPQGLLTRFIQSGGESMQEFFDRRIAPSLASLAAARAEFDKYMEKLIAKGQIPKDEGLRIAKDFVSSGQKGIDELQHKIEARAAAVLTRLKSISGLQHEVETLEAKIEQIERQIKPEARSKRKMQPRAKAGRKTKAAAKSGQPAKPAAASRKR